MVGGQRDLNDLGIGLAFENAMADLGRLNNQIARLEPEGFALVLINYLYPALRAIDQLQFDLVVVNVVGYLAVKRKPYARYDETRAVTFRREVGV